MAKIKGNAEHRIDVNTLVQIHDGAIDYFNKLHARGKTNEDYYSCNPFTDSQKSEYAIKDRIPFSISSIASKLNSIISTERTNRVSWKCKAKVEPDDISEDPQQKQQLFEKEIKAELATLRMRMIATQNRHDYLISDTFASGVAVIYGAQKIFADVNKWGDPQIRLKDVDYRNLIWDVNSIEYEHNDAQWMCEKEYVYRVDLIKQYPDKLKLVKGLSIGDPAINWGRKKTNYYVNYNKDGVSDLDLLTVFHHYHKVNRVYYTVLFNGQIVSCERKKADAEKTLRMLQLPYLTSRQDLPPADIVETPKLMLDYYKFTYTEMIKYEETDLEVFPYSIYQAFQYKNRIWTMSDILMSMQQLANRMLAQIDYAFGIDLKNKWEIFLPALQGTGLSIEQAMAQLDEKGFIPTMQRDAIRSIKSQGANPQWIQIMETMISLIDEIGGGKTFSGTANSANQSGKAINSLIGQGQMLTNAFIDNRNRFLTDLGNKLLWFMKHYDNTPYIMRIEGGALSKEMLGMLQQQSMYAQSVQNPNSGYVSLNKDNKNYLENADYELEVIEESLSENKKEQRFATMTAMEQSDQKLLLSPTWRKKKIESLEQFSYEDRSKIEDEIAQAEKAQAEAAQQQQQIQNNLEKAKILTQNKPEPVKQEQPK
jgi:hypothetical protein